MISCWRATSSAAEIQAEQASAALSVTIDSGPQVNMGELKTEGLERVPEKLVQRYVRYSVGSSYEQSRLDQWQQDLQSTAFFRGAFVSLQQPGGQAAPEPISDRARAPGAADALASAPAGDPSVSGAAARGGLRFRWRGHAARAGAGGGGAAQRLSVSMGVDDEAGARLESIYRQNVVFGQPLTLETGFSVDRLRQRAYADFLLPPTERGYKDSFGVLADRSDIQGLEVTRYALGATRLQERKGAGDSRVEYETRWGLLLAQDHVRIEDGDEYTLPSATATAEWLRRDVDSKYDPREGNLIAVGGGLGVVLNTGEPYARPAARAEMVAHRQARRADRPRRGGPGQWQVQVPDDFGFRTGGARSIRGYKYQSIGLKRNSAIAGAPAMEYDHYFNERRRRAFHSRLQVPEHRPEAQQRDRGRAGDGGGSVEYDHYFNERWGMGVRRCRRRGQILRRHVAGGRLRRGRARTPAGPFVPGRGLWPARDRSLRLHFSLGIAF